MNTKKSRPITNLEEFESAIKLASLDDTELQIIEYVRFIGTFSQPSLIKELRIKSTPPILSRISTASRKIGIHMPTHFKKVREWSEMVSAEGVRWDGDLICSAAWNIDGKRLCPEEGTSQFHIFAVHQELFQGFD